MRVLWAHESPMTAQEVIDCLAPSKKWSPRTVKTLLNRLLKKNAVTYETKGEDVLLLSVGERGRIYRMERRTFLQRLYNGALAPMMVHFLKDEKLTKEEIEQLRRILDEKEKGAP